MELNDLSSIIDKYGIKGAFFIVIIFLLIGALKSKWITEFLSKLSDKFVERFMKSKTKDINSHVKMITDSDITNHDASFTLPVIIISLNYILIRTSKHPFFIHV